MAGPAAHIVQSTQGRQRRPNLRSVAVVIAAVVVFGGMPGAWTPARAATVEFQAVEQDPLPSWVTLAGGETLLSYQTLDGAVAAEFGHDLTIGNFDPDRYATSGLYEGPIPSAERAVLGNFSGGTGLGATELVAVGGSTLYVANRQRQGHGVFRTRALTGPYTPVKGVAVLPDSQQILVAGDGGVGTFVVDSGSGSVDFEHFTTTALGEGRATNPIAFENLLDLWQRPAFDHYPHELVEPNPYDLVAVGRRADSNDLTVLVLRANDTDLTFQVIEEHTISSTLPVTDARIRYDLATDYLDAQPHYAIGVHWIDSATTGHLTRIVSTDSSSGVQRTADSVCHGPADRAPDLSVEVLNLGEPEGTGGSRQGEWAFAAGCSSILPDDTLRVHVDTLYATMEGANSGDHAKYFDLRMGATSALANDGSSSTLHDPTLQINFPCLGFLRGHDVKPGASFTCNQNGNGFFDSGTEFVPTPSSLSAVVHVQDAAGNLLLANRSYEPPDLFDYYDTNPDDCGAPFSCPLEFGAVDLIAQNDRILQSGLTGSTPTIALPAKPETWSMQVQVDDATPQLIETGDPIPMALLAAPPTVAGAGQDIANPVFGQSSSSGQTTTESHSNEYSLSFGFEVEDPSGANSAAASFNFGQAFENSVDTSHEVTYSDFYEGRQDAHTIVYETLTAQQWTGEVISSTNGLEAGRIDLPILNPTGSVTTARTIESFQATFPTFWAEAGSSIDAALPEVGNPGDYTPFDISGGAVTTDGIDEYCRGSAAGTLDPGEVLPTSALLPNPWLTTTALPVAVDLLIGSRRSVTAGAGGSVVTGSGFEITEGSANSRLTNNHVGVDVEGKVGYVTAGFSYTHGWGNGIERSVSEGVSFEAGVGSLPVELENEEYDWLTFLCQRDIEGSFGRLPVYVLNYATSNYSGSGGLEPFGPVALTEPIHSESVGRTPDFEWSQPDGTIESYDLELEAVGAVDTQGVSNLAVASSTADPAAADRDVVNASWSDLGFSELLASQLYRWRVTSHDFLGAQVQSEWEHFVTQGPPKDVVVAPDDSTPDIGQTVTLNISHTQVSGDIEYRIQWGDGTEETTTDPNPTHVYAGPGVYYVIVEAVSQFGSTFAQTVITVRPTVVDRTFSLTEDTPRTVGADIGLLFDSEGADQVVSHTQPARGTVEVQPDGSFTYTPNPNSCLDDSFEFTASGGGLTASATATMRIQCVNDAPTVPDSSHDTVEGTTLEVNAPGLLLGYDDVESDIPTAIVIATPPAHGEVFILPTLSGAFAYTPEDNYCGPDSFTYVVTDDGSDPGPATSDAITVTINVECVNDPPSALAVVPQTMDEDESVTFETPGTDNDGDPLTVQIVIQPAHGTATAGPGLEIAYTPDADYCNGDGDPDEVIWVLDDGLAQSNQQTASLVVLCVADAPVAVADDTVVTDEDAPVTIDPLANDTDPDEGDVLSMEVVSGPSIGTMEPDGNGAFTYTPNPNACGPDAFTYIARDSDGFASDEATVDIQVNCVNDPPVASQDEPFQGTEDAPVVIDPDVLLANDTDVEGDDLAVTITIAPSDGTLSFPTSGNDRDKIVYTPDADFCGQDLLAYAASDGMDLSNEIGLVIDVTCVNDAPVTVVDPLITTDEDMPTTVNLVANDTDVDGDELSPVVTSQPSQGSITIEPDGQVTYLPDPDYCGTDVFGYAAFDGEYAGNAVVIPVLVTCVNDAPRVGTTTQSGNGDEDTSQDNDTAGNVTDPDAGDTVLIVVTDESDNGDVTVDQDTLTITYTPDPDYCGTDSYTYVFEDSQGAQSDPVTVDIDVTCVNDPPRINADSQQSEGNEDEPQDTDTSGNVVDPDAGDTLTLVITDEPDHGDVEIDQGTLTITYTPDPDYCSDTSPADSYTYVYEDSAGTQSDPVTVNVDVTCVNDAPTVVDDVYEMIQADSLTVAAPGVLGNDSDVEGDAFTASVDTGPANGTLSLAPEGGFTYTPDTAWYGTDMFTYRANDGAADSDVATVTISVRGLTEIHVEPIVIDRGKKSRYHFTFEAILTDLTGAPIAGRDLEFWSEGEHRCTAQTNADGLAQCDVSVRAWTGAVREPYVVYFRGDDQYVASEGTEWLVR